MSGGSIPTQGGPSRPPDVSDAASKIGRGHPARDPQPTPGAQGSPKAPRPTIKAVYFSNVTDHACEKFAELGPGYWAFLTADPASAYQVTQAQVQMLKSGGGKVGAWNGNTYPKGATQ